MIDSAMPLYRVQIIDRATSAEQWADYLARDEAEAIGQAQAQGFVVGQVVGPPPSERLAEPAPPAPDHVFPPRPWQPGDAILRAATVLLIGSVFVPPFAPIGWIMAVIAEERSSSRRGRVHFVFGAIATCFWGFLICYPILRISVAILDALLKLPPPRSG